MVKTPRITVVIPTYNEEKNIRRALSKLNHQSIPREDYEVIIVDGDSTDRTIEIAELLGAKVVKQRGKGIGGARNDGFIAAKAEFVATTDADCIVPNQWLQSFLEDFQDPQVVAVTGPNGPIEKNWKAKVLYFILRCFGQGVTLFKIFGTTGTNSAFRRRAFLECGGYKSLPYVDDVEIGSRIKKFGKIVYDTRTYVNISVRRLEQKGYFNVILKWLKGDIYIFLKREIKTTEKYEKQNYTEPFF